MLHRYNSEKPKGRASKSKEREKGGLGGQGLKRRAWEPPPPPPKKEGSSAAMVVPHPRGGGVEAMNTGFLFNTLLPTAG